MTKPLPTVTKSLVLALLISPSAFAIMVDPSDSPTKCALPAGSTLAGCHVDITCDRTDTLGAIHPGTLQKEKVDTQDQKLCAAPLGGPGGTVALSGTLTGNISTTFTASGGVDVGLPNLITLKGQMTASLQTGFTVTYSFTQTLPCASGKWSFIDAYISHEINRTQDASVVYACTAASNSALNFLDPSVAPSCRGTIAPVTYPGGSGTIVGTLPDGILPHFSTDLRYELCPEQPKP